MILCNPRTSCMHFSVLSDPSTAVAAAISCRSADDLPRFTSAAVIVRNNVVFFSLMFGPWEQEYNFFVLLPPSLLALMNCTRSEQHRLLQRCRISVSPCDNSASVESRLSGSTDTFVEQLRSVLCSRRTRG